MRHFSYFFHKVSGVDGAMFPEALPMWCLDLRGGDNRRLCEMTKPRDHEGTEGDTEGVGCDMS